MRKGVQIYEGVRGAAIVYGRPPVLPCSSEQKWSRSVGQSSDLALLGVFPYKVHAMLDYVYIPASRT